MKKRLIFDVPEDLDQKIKEVAKKLSLTKSSVAKISINRFCEAELKV